MIQIILLDYICETDTSINTTASNTTRLLSNTMAQNSAYHSILCLYLVLLGVTVDGVCAELQMIHMPVYLSFSKYFIRPWGSTGGCMRCCLSLSFFGSLLLYHIITDEWDVLGLEMSQNWNNVAWGSCLQLNTHVLTILNVKILTNTKIACENLVPWMLQARYRQRYISMSL